MKSSIQTLARTHAAVDPWGHSPQLAEEYTQAKEELNQQARDRWDDPEFHRQVAADLESILDYQFTFENLFSTYFNVENVGEWDKVILRERRGLKVFQSSRGGYIEESQLAHRDVGTPSRDDGLPRQRAHRQASA